MTDADQLAGAVAVRRAITSCSRCDLRLEARQPVAFRGPLNPTLAVLGEAPGATEDTEQLPFVGVAGRYLTKCLTEAGLDERRVGFLNVCCCFPSRTRTPTSIHIDACRTHLVGQLKAIRPSHLLTVGVTAFNAVRPETSSIPLRLLLGRPWWLERLEPWPKLSQPISVCSTYHPAARSPSQKLRMKQDIEAFVTWINNKDPFPSNCTRCGKEVTHWSDDGLGWCSDHEGVQGTLI